MATDKQIRMLFGRAKAAGFPLKEAEVRDLNNGQIDKLLAKIEAYKQPAESTVKQADVTDIRFGLAQKLVALTYIAVHKKFWTAESFDEDVHAAYDALEQSEETYRSH